MEFVDAIARRLHEVSKNYLVAGCRYLMVDDQHAIVVECKLNHGRMFAYIAKSYVIGANAMYCTSVDLSELDNQLVKFFALPSATEGAA
jgi:hypothetical protein